MAEWKDFIEKKAQLIMPPIYKPEVYQQGAENIANRLGMAGKKLWGGIGALAGGAAGLLGGAWEGAGENDRTGTGFVEGIKNIGRNALIGAKAGARKGFRNPALLGSALESSVSNLPGRAVDMVVGPFSQNAADKINSAIDHTPYGSWQRYANGEYERMMEGEYKRNDSSQEDIQRSNQWKNIGEGSLLSAGYAKALAKPFSAHPVATVAAVSGAPLAVKGVEYAYKKPDISINGRDENVSKTIDFVKKHPELMDGETWSEIDSYHKNGDISDEEYSMMNDAIDKYRAGELYGRYSGSPHRMTDDEWSSLGKYRERGFVSDADYSRMKAARDNAKAIRDLMSKYPPEVVAELIEDIKGRQK